MWWVRSNMGEYRPSPLVTTAPAVLDSDRGPGHAFLVLLSQVWPEGLPTRDVLALPPGAVELVRPGPPSRPLRRAAGAMDRLLPGWPEHAAELVSRALGEAIGPTLQRTCLLLAQRPLRDPAPIVRLLTRVPPDPEVHLWALLALAGTDTAEVRTAWLEELRRIGRSPTLAGSRAAWFAFLRATQGGWLTWTEFRDCLASGRALWAAGPGYRRALERLGLWSQPGFAKWYREVVYEVATQPDASLSFVATGWIKDFPGADYLHDGLRMLTQGSTSWWPCYLLRHVSDVQEGEETAAALARHAPWTLCLLSLLRPDLSPMVADAWHRPDHAEVIAWLTTATATQSLDGPWMEEVLRPWAESYGEALGVAVNALSTLEPPPDFAPEQTEEERRGAFCVRHLGAHLERVVENVTYVLALSPDHRPYLMAEAKQGRLVAIRALALQPEATEEVAPLLFRLARDGRRAVRQAAQEALHALGDRVGIHDLDRLETRLDLAHAWRAEETEAKQAQVWWDVSGFHVRLALLAGKAKLQVYSGTRLLSAPPAALRRDPRYPEIRGAREELARRYRYFRQRFEQAMVEGVSYRGQDFAVLLASPVVRSLAARLVLEVDGRAFHWSLADPMLESAVPEELASAEEIRIAHPARLHRLGELARWQEHVFTQHVEQPFKQVFREMYAAEGEEEARESRRLADLPLNARAAFALLRRQGYSPGSGEAVKEWPAAGLRAHLQWARPEEPAGKLLAQAAPEAPVHSGAVWIESSEGEALSLGEVPPNVLSEALRDLDLVVSHAAYGDLGFTSQETCRLRATLIRCLVAAMGLTTVYVSGDHTHALVEGRRASYRLHLASGSVLLEPSRRHLRLPAHLSVLPDPALAESMDALTAQIIGFVASLARDDEITDDDFLRQLGAA
jgi:hypothetical protein